MILLGVSKAAVGHDRLPGGIVTGAGAEEFGSVGFGAAGLVVVIEPSGAHRHLPG